MGYDYKKKITPIDKILNSIDNLLIDGKELSNLNLNSFWLDNNYYNLSLFLSYNIPENQYKNPLLFNLIKSGNKNRKSSLIK